MRFRPRIFLSILFGLASTVLAQSTAPALKDPVLQRAPAFASWTITLRYTGEDAGKPAPLLPGGAARVRTITVTKTNKAYREQITLTSGVVYEKWVFDKIQLQTIPGSPSILPLDPPTDDRPEPDYSDYGRSDFPGLEWVSLENYKGTATDQGRPAFRFESDEKTLLLSAETQLPLHYFDGEATRTYVFNPPPTTPLTPPEKFLSALETHKRGLEALKYHPSRP